MDGVILLNKTKGMTSFDAVFKCRKILQEKKAGHSGTLDPNAEGLLILFFGKYTKLIPFCVKNHKRYAAEFEMGLKTETQDIWGAVVEKRTPHAHSDEELENACIEMRGRIKQIPPMYSALKKNGKKLYEYAREGIEVEREARDAEISELTVKHLHDNTYRMEAVVSSGTYIRTLIEDYCAKLNELGTMTALVREGIENISLNDAVSLEELSEGKGFVDPIRVIDPAWKMIQANEQNVHRALNGMKIRMRCDSEQVIFKNGDQLLAAYKKEEDGYYHSVRGLF